jgi:Domain of unknown function (DUF4126)
VDVGTAMGAGWSSGISVYGVVALVGVAGRFGWIEAPSFVEQWWVIGVAVALFLVEFVIDKIALLDTAWDGVHTLIRPAIGGYLMSTATDTHLSVPALAVSGVLLALSSHSAKTATRLVVNTSPEPFSNVALSLLGDGLVPFVLWLSWAHPVLLFATLGVALVAMVAAIWVLGKFLRRAASAVALRYRRPMPPAAHTR